MAAKRLVPIPDSAPIHLPDAAQMGTPEDTERLTVTVVLKRSEAPSDLHKKVKDIETMLPLQRPRLTSQEIEAVHSADESHVEHVKEWAKAQGVSVVDHSSVRRQVVLEGTVGDFNAAFGVELKYFQHGGGRYLAHSGNVQVPEEIGDCVSAVIGLDSIPRSAPAFATTERQLKEDGPLVGRELGATAVRDFARRQYNFPVDELDGSGQRVAIITFGGGYHQDDLDQYFAGLEKPPTVRPISVKKTKDGPGPACHPYPMKKLGMFIDALNDPELSFADVRREVDCAQCLSRAMATLETTMDIEILGAIAPGAEIDVLFTDDNKDGWINAVNAALAEHPWTNDSRDLRRVYELPSVISISWGWGIEAIASTLMDPLDEVFQTARSKQVTVCCASGDLGSGGTEEKNRAQYKLANLNYPASDPYVLACGGSTVEPDGEEEKVWNAPFKGKAMATGGGVSGYFMRPDYQEKSSIPVHKELKPIWLSPSHKVNREWYRGRGVPDVAANADQSSGYDLVVGGRRFLGGGTSASTPLWAGLITLINQRLSEIANERVTLGFMNPLIYSHPEVRKTFRSIDTGNNLLDRANANLASFKARPGKWDACTGLGVPDGQGLLRVLTQQ